MRRFLIALLMIVLAGAHSAAALADLSFGGHEMEQVHSQQNDQLTLEERNVLPSMECCQNLDASAQGGKSASCSADCPWFCGEIRFFHLSPDTICFAGAHPALTEAPPLPDDRPPRHF